MLHRIPRSVRWVLLVALLGAVTVSVVQSWASGAPGTGGWQQTQWGPLGPADRDLLIKVRQAGLWELPTGQQMAQQATNQAVRDTGAHLAQQHAVLDQIDRDAADKLGVQLPSRASDQQIGWMNQISSSTGSDYDRTAVQLLRQAHGIVLPVIADVRVGTRNELVRQFADTAFQYVTGHIAMLEATGLVDYSALPQAPSPGLLSGATTPADMIVPAIVFLACVAAAVGLIVTLRRGRTRKAAASAPATGRELATLHAPPLVSIPEPRDPPGRRRRALVPAGPAESAVSATGGHRRRRSSDSGSFRRDDSGAFRYVDATPRRASRDAGLPPAGADDGPYPAVTDTGSHRRSGSSSGAFRFDDLLGDGRADTTGGHRVPRTTDTGGHPPYDAAGRSPRSATRGLTR
jgi:predicted outer membrane protein